jgi:hypothetical protein
MTKDEALKLALEALKGVLDDSPKVMEASISGGLYEVVQCKDAITAIKEALAQPAQEPVAHLWECLGRWSAYLAANGEKAEIAPPSWLVDAIKNATTPPAAKPAQEPVAWGVFEGNLHDIFFTQAEAQEMAELKGSHAEVRPLYIISQEKNS